MYLTESILEIIAEAYLKLRDKFAVKGTLHKIWGGTNLIYKANPTVYKNRSETKT